MGYFWAPDPPAVRHHTPLPLTQTRGESSWDLFVPSSSQLSAWYDGEPRTQQLAANWRTPKTCGECRRSGSAPRPAARSVRQIREENNKRRTTWAGWRSVRSRREYRNLLYNKTATPIPQIHHECVISDALPERNRCAHSSP